MHGRGIGICFKPIYGCRNSEHKQRARTKTHAFERVINIEYGAIRRSRRYLGSRCIVSFGSDVKFRVELPGGLGVVALQPRVPVVTRPPGDVSRHQQTHFLSLEGRWRRRRGRRWSTVGHRTAAAAEGGPVSRIQVDGWRVKRETIHPGTCTSRRVSRAHLANCKMRVFLNPGWTRFWVANRAVRLFLRRR